MFNPSEVVQKAIVTHILGEALDHPEIALQLESAARALIAAWGLEYEDVLTVPTNYLVGLFPKRDTTPEAVLAQTKEDALHLLATNDPDNAIRVASLGQETGEILALRAAANLKKGLFQEAKADLEKAIDVQYQTPVVYQRLVFSLWSLNLKEEAMNRCIQGLSLYPNDGALTQLLSFLGPFENSDIGIHRILKGLENLEQTDDFKAMLNDPEIASLVDLLRTNPSEVYSMMGNPKLMHLMSYLVSHQGI